MRHRQPARCTASHNYAGQCWWCGDAANSREHKYKKSDLAREFGTGPYSGDSAVLRFVEGKGRRVRGPGSEHFTFGPVLCQRCNNARSQPFDLAYDTLQTFMIDNEEAVLRSRHFRFSDVYGPDWRDARDNLAKFYVKQLACKLAEAKLLVPAALIDFLNGRARQPSGLTMWFEVAQDVLAFLRASRTDGEQFSPGMGHGGLRAELTTSGEILQLQTFASCRWLVLRYFLDNNSRPPRPNFLRSNRVSLLEGFGHFADNDPSAGPASDLSA